MLFLKFAAKFTASIIFILDLIKNLKNYSDTVVHWYGNCCLSAVMATKVGASGLNRETIEYLSYIREF